MKQLFPDVSVTLAGDGHVEIPASVVQQLKQLQHTPSLFLPASNGILGKEPETNEALRAIPAETFPETQVIASSMGRAEQTQKPTDLAPEAKQVLTYLFSQPQDAVIDWKAVVQRALDLPEPPKLKSHKAYKAVQQAYRLLERIHEGDLTQPSKSLTTFYTEYILEGGRWGDLKDTMGEWGIF